MALNEDQLETVKTRWTIDGDSAGQIAASLSVTRNVVIGVIHRRGWVQAGGAATRPRPRLPMEPRAPKPPAPPKPKPEPVTFVVDDPAQHVSMDQLGPHHCRYPVGDEGKYCGQRPNETPYCEGHARIVYQPQQPRKIKRPR